ncbi:MAG: HpaII family restriction endonuclease [Treponema sp.]|nr:HpaII family restriction endonuclease [Treponema sp.]
MNTICNEQITKNKGEWSEAYVLLKLLLDGQIFEQNQDGTKSTSYMKVLSVIKIMKSGNCFEFKREKDFVECILNGKKYKTIFYEEFLTAVQNTYDEIKNGKGRSFSAPKTEEFFINKLELVNFKSDSNDKNDIYLKIENPKDGSVYIDGFSVKSLIGKSPSLFNCSNASNLVYRIKDCTEQEMNDFNEKAKTDFKPAIIKFICDNRLNFLNSKFMDSKNSKYGDLKIPGYYFAWNVDLLDIRILDVFSEMVKIFYGTTGNSKLLDMLNILQRNNPLGVKFPDTFYEMKIRQFLFASFCGLTASEKWTGKQKVNGGYIEVQKDGGVLYQKAISDEKFTDYLIETTRMDGPSKDKYDYGKIYFSDEYNCYCINLNFQVRFR